MKTERESIYAGILPVKDVVNLTDPSYRRDVWCRINDVPMVQGNYGCVAVLSDEGEWGKRVAKIGIYLDGVIPDKEDMQLIVDSNGSPREVGVDSGNAGIFTAPIDFAKWEWVEWCNNHDCHDRFWLDEDGCASGFAAMSGFGDGGYYAYVHKCYDGLADAVEIVFIEEGTPTYTPEDIRELLRLGLSPSQFLDRIDGQDCKIFKADDFKEDDVIYIPDLEPLGLGHLFEKDHLSDKEIDDFLEYCFTGEDFFEECDGDINVAMNVFELMDGPSLEEAHRIAEEHGMFNDD